MPNCNFVHEEPADENNTWVRCTICQARFPVLNEHLATLSGICPGPRDTPRLHPPVVVMSSKLKRVPQPAVPTSLTAAAANSAAAFSPAPMPSREAPGFLEKVKNFATAAAKHVAAGMPMASDEEIIRRHDICLTCEFLKDNACTKCGCPISRVAGYVSKLSWADQECPVGKWGKAASANK